MAIGEDLSHLGKIWHKLHRAVYQSHVIGFLATTEKDRSGVTGTFKG
jgi:hypothetical protein